MVGVTGFEPAASSSRTTRATKLRHTPCDARVSLSGDFFSGALQTQRVEWLDREADAQMAKRSGCEAYLVKPLDALRLQRAAKEIAR